MTTLFTSFAEAILDFLSPRSTPDPMIRLFQVEYAKEYKMLVDNGVRVDRELALDHMNR